MFMFALNSTPKFEIVNFPCGPSSGTNKNQHTYRLRSSVPPITSYRQISAPPLNLNIPSKYTVIIYPVHMTAAGSAGANTQEI